MMVTRLFASKNSSSQSSRKNSAPNDPPPPPPPASNKPTKTTFFSSIGKPPRKRPTNLPLSQPKAGQQHPPQSYRSQYSSKTPPASTFRAPGHLRPSHTDCGHASASASSCGGRLPIQQQACAQPRPTHLPSTYLSFADSDSNSSYLDLIRARSDESLLWTAEQEASALVAELRASLNCNSVSSDNNLNSLGKQGNFAIGKETNHKLNPYQLRPERTDDSDDVGSGGLVDGGKHHDQVQYIYSSSNDALGSADSNPFQRSFSVQKRNSDARLAAQKLNHLPPPRSLSFTDLQSAVELLPLNRPDHCRLLPDKDEESAMGVSCSGSLSCCHTAAGPGTHRDLLCESPLRNFGGSWKSLLRVGAMSGRTAAKPPGAGIKKVAPPTVPGHHLQHASHLQHHSSSSDPTTPSLTPTHGPAAPTLIIPSPQSNLPSLTPDTPTSSTSGGSSAGNNYRHSGCSFHSSSTSSSGVYTDQRASFSSSVSSSEDAVSTNSSNPPPSPCSPSSGTSSIEGRSTSARLGPNTGSCSAASPAHYMSSMQQQNAGQFTFPVPPSNGGQSPAAPQISVEDQGIDVQSPARSSSPGSGSGSSSTGSTASTSCCRNSTTSLDSGRASTSTHHHHHHPHQQHRLSGQSYDSGSGNGNCLRRSCHSSSSSIGSIDSPVLNVNDLLNNGVRDSEVLRAWLSELHLEEHTDKFIIAGYDLPTISRVTPEDLNAIGITKPAHRKKLKAEISKLNIRDGLPDYIPATLEEWLAVLKLSEYNATLQRQGYRTPVQMLQVMWEDLEEMGITRLGHQKKVMLAIKRINDIKSGKKFSSNQSPLQQLPPQEIVLINRAEGGADNCYSPIGDMRTFSGQASYSARGPAEPYNHQRSGSGASTSSATNYNSSGAQFSPCVYRSYSVGATSAITQQHHDTINASPLHRQLPRQQSLHATQLAPGSGSTRPPSVQYRPDVVAVQVNPQVRRSKDGIFEEPIYSTFHPENNRLSQYHQQFTQLPNSCDQFSSLPSRPNLPPMTSSFPPRSLDDGDITPTNEMVMYEGGGGTLPRQRCSNNKVRPVAKVTAKTRVDVHQEMSYESDSSHYCAMEDGNQQVKSDPLKPGINLNNLDKVNNVYNIMHAHSTNNTPQGTPKKLPPPPPRRSNSVSEANKQDSVQSTFAKGVSSQQNSNIDASGCSKMGPPLNSNVLNSRDGFLRRSFNYGYMGVKNNLQPDISSDLPPPPPAPHDVGNHQFIHHHHSHRRSQDQMMVTPEEPADDAPPSGVDSSAPAPLSRELSNNSSTHASGSATSTEHEDNAVSRPRRNDSTVSNCSMKSTSSTDSSDSIPFANDNAGTIKQRYNAAPPLGVPGHHVITPHLLPGLASPVPSPSTLRRVGNPHRASMHKNSPARSAVKTTEEGNVDVLNDIGNMLANLTDELDAMLEQEMAA
ncbi:uncharacterized protein LOC108672229 isoform X2 [Hyalella azteca]|uniref:Uncharacterized protein LOC108672229 isoform X2 n=1 Tax=Hyalella azteca TaxID=294128 RepID=A0A8B7NQI1_HYAAZ|nr:uncharacterized protein LOC108672229 isoform X2 [Hyalella azteca]